MLLIFIREINKAIIIIITDAKRRGGRVLP